jgi:hypothetical protein
LALACPSCNLKKSDRETATDPLTDESVPLFHPRTDAWPKHFHWKNYELIGITPNGRATIQMLELNSPRRLMIREAEAAFDLFPPK